MKRNDEKPIWMPFYIGDYMADTSGLTLAEHGAYCLAIFAYWRKRESLDDDELKGICRNEFKRISKFFVLCDGRWHHKRIDKELKEADERISLFRERSRKALEARKALGQIKNLPIRRKA